MSRLFGLALALAAASSTASAAPKVAEKGKARVYFPTVVGMRVEFTTTYQGGQSVVHTQEVVAVAERDGVTTVTMARLKTDGTRQGGYTVEGSDEGVRVVAEGETKYDPPVWLVKGPTKPGTTWEVTAADGKSIMTVLGEETVETPAGTFKAVRVNKTYSNGRPGSSEWYAPGLGRVQQQTAGRKLQLTAVTRPKKE
jgi:hypothetical protein